MIPQTSESKFSQDEYKQTLLDAESLLKYAAKNGCSIDKGTEEAVLKARTAFDRRSLDEATTGNLLNSLATLANMVAPVTPESLRALRETSGRPPYRKWAIGLAVIIIVYSTVSFVTSSIADAIRADITTANALAVKLNSEFPATAGGESTVVSPQGKTAAAQSSTSSTALPSGVQLKDVIKDFQEYATCVRDIDFHVGQLSWFIHLYNRVFHPQLVITFYKEKSNFNSLKVLF
jgi:uncharacterized membrane protein YjfL (UPF0719 family)